MSLKKQKSEDIETVKALRSSLQLMIEETLGVLVETWQDMGLKSPALQDKLQNIHQELNSACSKLIKDADDEHQELKNCITKLVSKMYSLRKRLRISGPIEGYEETPLTEVVEEFKNKITEYENQIETSLSNIRHLLTQEEQLCQQLGISPKGLSTKPLPLPKDVTNFEEYIEELRGIVFQNQEEFLELREDIKSMLSNLDETPVEEFHRLIVSQNLTHHMPITQDYLTEIREWHSALKSKVTEQQTKAKESREKLISLWELLEEDPEYKSKFANENLGFSLKTIHTMNIEIERCEKKKRENIKVFVEKFREEIAQLWDKCMFGEQQRNEFTLYRCNLFNEDMLTIHELQLRKLKIYYEENKVIFEKLAKRNELMQRCIYLSERAYCPGRYQNRGGQLLQEEKERKQVNQKLPILEKQILELVNQYDEQKGQQFMIYDCTVAEVFEEDWNNFKRSQENKKKARDILRSTQDLHKIAPSPARLPSKSPSRSLLRPAASSAVNSPPNGGNSVKRKLLAVAKSVQPKRIKVALATDRPATDTKKPRRSLTKLKTGNKPVTLAVRRNLYPSRRSRSGVSAAVRRISAQKNEEYAVFEDGFLIISVRSSVFQHANDENLPSISKLLPKSPKSKTATFNIKLH